MHISLTRRNLAIGVVGSLVCLYALAGKSAQQPGPAAMDGRGLAPSQAGMRAAQEPEGEARSRTRIYMDAQCRIWSDWLRKSSGVPDAVLGPAPQGMPCFRVQTDNPVDLYPLPDGVSSNSKDPAKRADANDENQALPEVMQLATRRDKEAARATLGRRIATDSYFLGGTGPVPDLVEYMELANTAFPGGLHIVQIGAHKGGAERNEWVHPVLDKYKTWSATVIEPIPWLFKSLQENYRDYTRSGRVEPMNFAVTAAKSGPCAMKASGDKQYAALALDPEQTAGTKCGDKGRPCNFHNGLAKAGVLTTINATCITLPKLLRRRARLRPVDILVVDAEMLDYTLLRSWNLRELGPLAIEFESKTMTAQQGAEIAALLAMQGYLCRFHPYHTMARVAPHYGRSTDPNRPHHAMESVCYRMV